MQEHPSSPRRIPVGIVAGISVLVVATGSAVAWWGWKTSHIANTPTEAQSELPQQETKSPPAAVNPAETKQPPAKSAPTTVQKTLQVYWLKGSGNEISLTATPVQISSTTSPNSLLKAAVQQLLEGPSNSTVTTTIPANTQLNSLSVQDDGIHIDLSPEFTRGGGSTSMTARVAQILYTATSLNPNAPVWLSVAGKPLETLGGEGLMLEQPLTRKSFERDFTL